MANYSGDSRNTFNGPTKSSPAGDPALPSKPNEGSKGDCSAAMPTKGTNSDDKGSSGHVQAQPQNRPRGTRGSGTTHNTVGY